MLFRKLLKQNFVMHYRQVRFIHWRYGSVVEPVYHFLATRLLWRLYGHRRNYAGRSSCTQITC